MKTRLLLLCVTSFLSVSSRVDAVTATIHQPTAADQAIVKPGQSYDVQYSYDVTGDPNFDPADGVRVAIYRRAPDSGGGVFNAILRTGSSSKSVSNAETTFEIAKPYYGDYGDFHVVMEVSTGDRGINLRGTHVFTTITNLLAVRVNSEDDYKGEITVSPTEITQRKQEQSSFTLTVRNTGTRNDIYSLDLSAATGWTYGNLPMGNFSVSAGDIKTYPNCWVQSPSTANDGVRYNTIFHLMSSGSGSRVDYDEIYVTISEPKPDFVVSSIEVSPSSPEIGDTLDMVVTVENQGTASGDAGTLKLRPDDYWYGIYSNVTVGAIAAGASSSITFHDVYVAPTSGTFTAIATIDLNDITDEINESNNQLSYEYSVSLPAMPDFVVTDIELSPASPAQGETFTAVVTVKNQGGIAGDGGWLDVWPHQPTSVSPGDDGEQSWRVNSLAVNETRAFTFTNLEASVDPGEYVFRAFVDSQGNTAELEEGNNQLTHNYSLSAGTAYADYLAAGETALLSKPILFNGTRYQVVGITDIGVETYNDLFDAASYGQPPMDNDDPYAGSEASTIQLFMSADPSFLVQYQTNGTWHICEDEATRAWIYHLSRAQVQADYRHQTALQKGVHTADPSHYDGSLNFRSSEALWFPTCWMLYAPILGDDDQQRYRQAAFEQPLQRYITHGQLSLFTEGYVPLPNQTDFADFQEKVIGGAIDAAEVVNFSKRRWQYFPPELAAARTSIGTVSTAWSLYQDVKDILVLHVLDADKVLLMKYLRDNATGVALDADFVAALDGYIENKSDLVNQQLDNVVNFSVQYVQDEITDYAIEKASSWLIAKCIEQGYTSAHAVTIGGVSLSAAQVLGIELVVAGLVIDFVANPEGVYEQRIVSHYAAKNAQNWEVIGTKLAGDIDAAAEIDELQADAYLMLEMMEREIYGNLCQNLVAATDASFAGGAAAGWASLLTPDQWRWTRGTAMSWEYAQQHWNDGVRYMIGRTRSQPLPPSELAPPTATITTPTSSSSYSTSASSFTLGGTATDDVGVVSVSWQLSGGPSGNCTGTDSWSSSPIPLTRGMNVITVTAWDAAGKAGTDTITVTYTPPDTQPPQVVISNPTSGSSYDTGVPLVSVSGTATDDGVLSSASWVNSRGGSGACVLSGSSVAAQDISLAEGDNVITLTVLDESGKSGSDSLTVTYTSADTQPPTVTIEYPVTSASFTTTVNKVSLGGVSSDDRTVSSVEWSNSSGGSGSCNGTVSWSVFDIPLLLGDNLLTITATDGAGHTASDTLSVTLSAAEESGAIQCNITPPTAVSAGATWRIDSDAWQPSGSVVTSVSTGQHTITFSSVNGWLTPTPQTVTVAAGQTNVITGTYTAAGAEVLDSATMYYPADQTNGTTVADAIGSNDGSIDDGSHLYFAYSDELERYCLRKEDSTTAGLTPAVAPVTDPTFTLSCWAKPATNASGGFFIVNTSPEKSYRIFSNRINYQYSSSSAGYPQRQGPYAEDRGWHHYAWVNTDNGDGTARLRMFVDGAKVVDDTLATTEYSDNVAASQKFLVQRPLSAYYYQFIGDVCNIAVFDGVELSDAQVLQLYRETDPLGREAFFEEDFEDYTVEAWPDVLWVKDANASDGSKNRVEIDPAGGGSQALRLYGVLGSYWAAIAYAPCAFSNDFFVSCRVYNGTESIPSSGHQARGSVGMRQGTSWSNPARNLFGFQGNGTITGGGLVLGTYTPGLWYDVVARYQRNGSLILMTYWVDGEFKGRRTVRCANTASEETLDHIELQASAGSAWFDDIRVYLPKSADGGILYAENFDSYSVGDLPAGWTRYYNASSDPSRNAVVTNEHFSGENSFQVYGQHSGMWASHMTRSVDLSGLTGWVLLRTRFRCSGDIETTASGHYFELQFGFDSQSDGEGGDHGVINVGWDTKGDDMGAIAANTGVWRPVRYGVWYDACIALNLDTLAYRVWIDGVELGSGGVAPSRPSYLKLSSGGGKAWIDDVLLATGIPEEAPLDEDGDELEDVWEKLHYQGLSSVSFYSDWDGDGVCDGFEEIAGTSPTDASRLFRITSADSNGPDTGELVITWDSVEGRIYTISSCSNLTDGVWTQIAEVPGDGTSKSYTSTVSSVSCRFLQLDVRKDE